jgi:hypothetical protein
VAEQDWSTVSDLYRKKFEITNETQIMTSGSCFAQHVAAHFRDHGYSVIDAEPPPPGLEGLAAKNFGYSLYSARYGNIYTVRQLLQLLREALEADSAREIIWEKDGRYFDALRPGIEPDGVRRPGEVRQQRRDHLERVRQAIAEADLFIFTFGLTEGWVDREDGTVYPTAPGTIAGTFDSDRYAFVNFGFEEIKADFLEARALLKEHRPELKFLLTVSPVPLTATASGDHVLPATIYSKSVLRAVAGELAAGHDDTDYFPSYEMVATPFLQRRFYEDNLRSVSPDGVASVMEVFFREHGSVEPLLDEYGRPVDVTRRTGERQPPPPESHLFSEEREEVVCEEILLEAFAPS